MRFFDTHAHLNHRQLLPNVPDVVARARQAGVEHIVVVGYDIASSQQAVALARSYTGMYAAIGVAPHDAHRWADADFDTLDDLATDPHVVAIGETGFEGHYRPDTLDRQREVLDAHAELALRHNLPLVIHLRQAADHWLAWLAQHPHARGVMHCFSGDLALAEVCLKAEFWISFAGPVSFKNDHGLRAIAATIPLDRLLVETDAPYLAPGRYRGAGCCEPFMLPETVTAIAKARSLSVEAIAMATYRNATTFFGLPANDL